MRDMLGDPSHSVHMSDTFTHLGAGEARPLTSSSSRQCSYHSGSVQEEGIDTVSSVLNSTTDRGGAAGRKSSVVREVRLWGVGKQDSSNSQQYISRRKSSIRSSTGKRVRKKKQVRFHGISNNRSRCSTLLISFLVSTFRPTSPFAMVWETFVAVMLAADLILIPLGILGRMFRDMESVWKQLFSHSLARRLAQKQKIWCTVDMAVDAVFILDLVYRVCRAFVSDLGYHDSHVDRLVFATTKNLPSSRSGSRHVSTEDAEKSNPLVCLLHLLRGLFHRATRKHKPAIILLHARALCQVPFLTVYCRLCAGF